MKKIKALLVLSFLFNGALIIFAASCNAAAALPEEEDPRSSVIATTLAQDPFFIPQPLINIMKSYRLIWQNTDHHTEQVSEIDYKHLAFHHPRTLLGSKGGVAAGSDQLFSIVNTHDIATGELKKLVTADDFENPFGSSTKLKSLTSAQNGTSALTTDENDIFLIGPNGNVSGPISTAVHRRIKCPIALSPDGTELIVGLPKKLIRHLNVLRDDRIEEEVLRIKEEDPEYQPPVFPSALAFLPQKNNPLLIIGYDNVAAPKTASDMVRLEIIDPKTGIVKKQLNGADRICSLQANNSHYVATTTKKAIIFDTHTLEETQSINTDFSISDCRLSPDSTYLALKTAEAIHLHKKNKAGQFIPAHTISESCRGFTFLPNDCIAYAARRKGTLIRHIPMAEEEKMREERDAQFARDLDGKFQKEAAERENQLREDKRLALAVQTKQHGHVAAKSQGKGLRLLFNNNWERK